MRAAATAGSSRTDALLADAARYLEDTAPRSGGRNARPLAIPVLVASHAGTARSAVGAAAAGLGALAGVALWFGLGRLEDDATTIGVVALVGAAVALVVAVVLGRRTVVGGSRLLGGLRRWYAVAPEVPVRGVEVLGQAPGVVRLVLAALGVVSGAAALAAAATTGTTAAWLGFGLAGVVLLAAGVLAVRGWWLVRTLLGRSAPQTDEAAFAPAPRPEDVAAAQPPVGAPQAWQPPPAAGWEQASQAPRPAPQQHPPGPSAAAAWQAAPGSPLPDASAHQQASSPWQQQPPPPPAASEPSPPPWQQPAPPRPTTGPPPQPWQQPAPTGGPPPAPDAHAQVAPAPAAARPLPGRADPLGLDDIGLDEIGETVYAGSDTTRSGRTRRRVAVVLDDGRELEVGAVSLVGRSPQPRPEEVVLVVPVQHPTVSKTHAAFRVTEDSVHVTDRASTNGTTVVDGTGYRRTLRPWAEEPVEIDSEVLLGSYLVRVRAAD